MNELAQASKCKQEGRIPEFLGRNSNAQATTLWDHCSCLTSKSHSRTSICVYRHYQQCHNCTTTRKHRSQRSTKHDLLGVHTSSNVLNDYETNSGCIITLRNQHTCTAQPQSVNRVYHRLVGSKPSYPTLVINATSPPAATGQGAAVGRCA